MARKILAVVNPTNYVRATDGLASFIVVQVSADKHIVCMYKGWKCPPTYIPVSEPLSYVKAVELANGYSRERAETDAQMEQAITSWWLRTLRKPAD